MTMADKIVVMRDGRVEQIGAPLDLYDQPSNVFVAGFIGSPSMNFVRGKLATENGETVFISEKGTMLPVPTGTSLSTEPVIYGIRPEHIDHRSDGQKAIISVLEPTGSETQIFAHIGGDPLNAVVKDRISLRPGEAIPLKIDRERVHLFDRKSGKRL
jgi:multiple sugar transport system ATP-binding protein